MDQLRNSIEKWNSEQEYLRSLSSSERRDFLSEGYHKVVNDHFAASDQHGRLCHHLDMINGYFATLSGVCLRQKNAMSVSSARQNDLMLYILIVTEAIDSWIAGRPNDGRNDSSFLALWPSIRANVLAIATELPHEATLESELHLLRLATEAAYLAAGCDPSRHVPLEKPWREFGASLNPPVDFEAQTIDQNCSILCQHLEELLKH